MTVRAHLALEGPGPDVVAQSQPQRRKMHALVLLLLVCAGLGLLVYPLAGTYLRNVHQESVAEAYRIFADAACTGAAGGVARYGSTLQRLERRCPFGSLVEPGVKEQCSLPRLCGTAESGGKAGCGHGGAGDTCDQLELPIYHGTEEDTLERGAGHLYGSALPVGGEGMHSVLTGHTGLTTATLFDRLNEVRIGDAFYVSVMGETLKYEVDHTTVVLPHET